MNSLPSVIITDKNQFHAICQNLSLLGTPGHEGLKIFQNNQDPSYPVTCKRSWLNNEQEQKVQDFVLTFFEKNLGKLAEESHPHALLTKVEPFFKNDIEKNRFYTLRQELYNLHAIKSTEQDRARIIQETEQDRARIIQETEQRVQDLERQLERRLEILKKEITLLEDTLEDTLLICQNIPLSAHLKKLRKVIFFNSCYQHSDMEKPSLTDTEKKHYKYKFDFSDFHSKTMMSLLDWIEDPNKITNLSDFNALFELYRLADFVNDVDFRADCLKLLKKELNEENKLYILTIAEYSSGDELIKECCRSVVHNFKHADQHQNFLKIKPEYFLQIIQDNELFIDSKVNFLKKIHSWAEVQAKQKKATLKEVLYETVEGHRLIDNMHFGNLSTKEFVSEVLPLQILSLEDTNKWLEQVLTQSLSFRGGSSELFVSYIYFFSFFSFILFSIMLPIRCFS